jgi:hypothetical protein
MNGIEVPGVAEAVQHRTFEEIHQRHRGANNHLCTCNAKVSTQHAASCGFAWLLALWGQVTQGLHQAQILTSIVYVSKS